MEGILVNRASEVVAVTDTSGVAAARRIGAQHAAILGLSETTVGKASLIITELATNLVKHGGGGSILFGSDDGALTTIAIDKGPGIRNVTTALRDGYSTAGSPGTGLGALGRLATAFDLYTHEDRGTAVFCRLAEEGSDGSQRREPFHVAGICIPKPGEHDPGDAWTAVSGPDSITIAVIDGLGHGTLASTASAAAVRTVTMRSDQPLEAVLQDAHAALRPTRGAAAGLARIQPETGGVEFAGVGNIAGAIVTNENVRRVVSGNGIVGHEMRKVQSFFYPWEASSILVLQSDGVSSNWALTNYPGLLQRDASLIAAVIYRDYCRGTDDATVVVAKAS
jgi:anti-sigma regulatory factor (Ser/Thr protein kinase)